jgi:hypothetical protein
VTVSCGGPRNWTFSLSSQMTQSASRRARQGSAASAALVSGTQNFTVTLKTAWRALCMTASNLTHRTITANHSPSISGWGEALARKLQLLVPGVDGRAGHGSTARMAAERAGCRDGFNVHGQRGRCHWNHSHKCGQTPFRSALRDSKTPSASDAALVNGTKGVQRHAQAGGPSPRHGQLTWQRTAPRRRARARRITVPTPARFA